jgi:hypothetical protein
MISGTLLSKKLRLRASNVQPVAEKPRKAYNVAAS